MAKTDAHGKDGRGSYLYPDEHVVRGGFRKRLHKITDEYANLRHISVGNIVGYRNPDNDVLPEIEDKWEE